jgi:hypothetical protein
VWPEGGGSSSLLALLAKLLRELDLLLQLGRVHRRFAAKHITTIVSIIRKRKKGDVNDVEVGVCVEA